MDASTRYYIPHLPLTLTFALYWLIVSITMYPLKVIFAVYPIIVIPPLLTAKEYSL